MPSVSTRRVTARFYPEQIRKMDAKAAERGETPSQYIQRLVLEDLHGHNIYRERLMAHRIMANSAMLAYMMKANFGSDVLKSVNRTAAELAAATLGPLPLRPYDYEVDEGTISWIQDLHDLLSR